MIGIYRFALCLTGRPDILMYIAYAQPVIQKMYSINFIKWLDTTCQVL